MENEEKQGLMYFESESGGARLSTVRVAQSTRTRTEQKNARAILFSFGLPLRRPTRANFLNMLDLHFSARENLVLASTCASQRSTRIF